MIAGHSAHNQVISSKYRLSLSETQNINMFSAVLGPHPQKSKQTNKQKTAETTTKSNLKPRKLCGLESVATIHFFGFPLFQIQSCCSPLSTLKTAPLLYSN